MEILIKNLDDLENLANRLAENLFPGAVVALNGDLGAGKTTFTKFLGKAMEVDDYITSPTFSLINEYDGKYKVYHMDMYRLENVDGVMDLGLDDYFYDNGVTIVEWADNIKSYLPKEYIQLDFNKESENERMIKIFAFGENYINILECLL